ncbi:MAG: YfcE family phosphodiesterase [Ruminiclostridium sp.]|nr:YfcE family phosphodiesterase [Ruminiclostridium sp.]
MRIIVMADSHGASSAVMKIVERNIYSADLFIHLGDGEDDIRVVMQEYPQIKLLQVRGNCDRNKEIPSYRIIETVPGPDDKTVKILATHGHHQHIDYGTDELVRLAKENDCEIALFGHTHCRCEITDDGVMLINPGSCAQPRDDTPPSYAYIDVTLWGVITGIVDLVD